MKISELRLKDILKDYEVWEQEIEYAGVPGIAEMYGYQIGFFRPQKELRSTVAINIQEIETPSLIHVANLVLRALDLNLKFGETTIEEINSIYGIADYTDDMIVDGFNYEYYISPDLLIVFTIVKKVLWGLEIFTDEEMVDASRECNFL